MRPRKVAKTTIDYLNNLETYDFEYLNSFQGSRSTFTHLDLKDIRYLEEHNRKGFFRLVIRGFVYFCSIFNLVVFYVLCISILSYLVV